MSWLLLKGPESAGSAASVPLHPDRWRPPGNLDRVGGLAEFRELTSGDGATSWSPREQLRAVGESQRQPRRGGVTDLLTRLECLCSFERERSNGAALGSADKAL